MLKDLLPFCLQIINNYGKLLIENRKTKTKKYVLQSRLELLTPEGLRVDGRRANELRKITAKTSVFSQADGSAYIEQGNTKCLAAVYGPREVN
jgi:exosome complex component RRP41